MVLFNDFLAYMSLLLAHLPLHKDYRKIRSSGPSNKRFEDLIGVKNRTFESLEIDFTQADLPHWPEAFDNFLGSYPQGIATPTASRDYIQFAGTRHKDEISNCSGVIHAIPPQHGIPGWQRVTMMTKLARYSPVVTNLPDYQFTQPKAASGKGFMLYSEGDTEDRIVDETCWAYEGVILPGGMIMLGHWWSPMAQYGMSGTGPWIFWKTSDRTAWDY